MSDHGEFEDNMSVQDTIDKTRAALEREQSKWIGNAEGMVE